MKKTKPANNTNQPTNSYVVYYWFMFIFGRKRGAPLSLSSLFITRRPIFFRISSEMPTANFLLSTQMLSVTCYRRRSKPVFSLNVRNGWLEFWLCNDRHFSSSSSCFWSDFVKRLESILNGLWTKSRLRWKWCERVWVKINICTYNCNERKEDERLVKEPRE